MAKSFIFIGGPVDGQRESIQYPSSDRIVYIVPKTIAKQFSKEHDEVIAPIEAIKHRYFMRKIRAGETTHHFYGYSDLTDSECIALLLMKYPFSL